MRIHCYVYVMTLFLLLAAIPAQGEDTGALFPLGLDGKEQTVSTSRTPRPVSRVAENVTAITAEQIAVLNAHTLADVLQTVPGIQLSATRTPGSVVMFYLQGAPASHVQLLLDGVPQNELTNNFADIGSIPAHYIERIEIIKGAASAAWGPALGGVINVITKSHDPEQRFSGGGMASYGEKGTSDLQLEASGTLERFGYYLAGNSLHSLGLLPNNNVLNKNIFGKMTYDLPGKGVVTLGLDYRVTDRGTTASPPDFYDYRENISLDHFSGYLNLAYPLTEKLSLDLLLRRTEQRFRTEQLDFAGQNFWLIGRNEQTISGGTAKLTWGDSRRSLAGGVEFEHAEVEQRTSFPPGYYPPVPQAQLDPPAVQTKQIDRYGIFLNGAWTAGALTILPGIRYDRVSINNDYFSYTLGATWQLTERTTLRAYGAKAYSLPYALISEGVQKVWTLQTGLESGDLPYLWLKGTLFYNIIEDHLLNFSTIPTTMDITREKRQGFELEARTVPLHGFTLSGGYTYTDYRERETNTRYRNIPTSLAKLALNYSNSRLGLKGILTGNYVWWHGGDGWGGSYKPIIWDLSLTRKLFPQHELSPEIFFSGHNLFNGSQYDTNTVTNNTRRWLEGGVRFRF